MKESRRKFSPEFKHEAVALVRRTDIRSKQVAQELSSAQTSLSRWIRETEFRYGCLA
jgi:transposase